MNRTRLALALIAAALAPIAMPAPVAAAPVAAVDQARWNASKKFVRLPSGLKLGYVEAGNPQGEPILLLHGYTDSSRSFSLLVPHLSSYRLLIPDQRGHGRSDAPECCYSLSQFAFDAKQFLDALGVQRAAIVGHSLGSMVAITMAAEYPDRVRNITLIGSTALAPVKRGDWLYDNALSLKAPLDPASQFGKDWHPANQPTPVDPAFAEAVNGEILRIPVHVWHTVMRELASIPAGRHAADVKAPVLILSGGKDPIFAAEHHRSLIAAFPQAEAHVYPELGHNPIWERPADIAERIVTFLSSANPRN
jgi:pimeloyl-ACP methyl ester carboxylesterase